MRLVRRLRNNLASWLACILALAAGAFPVAAAYPDKTVRIIVSNAPGGPTDVLARVLATELAPLLGGTLIVENKPGAASNIGITSVAKAEADGYTLLMTTGAVTVNPAISDKLGYDPLADFAPISLVATSPVVLAAWGKLGITSLADLVRLGKEKPDTLNYSSPGRGTVANIAAELVKLRTGLKMAHVPHAGAAPATQAAMNGSVQLTSTAIETAQSLIETGQLTGLAVTSDKRWRALPSVPTLMELGIAEVPMEFIVVFLAPAKTPPEIVARLATLSRQVLDRTDVRARMSGMGVEVVASTPDALRARMVREIAFYRDMAAQIGLKP